MRRSCSTVTGLGYTAIEAARCGAIVTTIEWDPAVESVAGHYIGNPDSPSGTRVSRGVERRLKEAGFNDVRRQPEAFGISARA